MTSLFKRVLLTLSVAMLLSLPISGQDKHFEHNIYIGLGGAHSFEGEDDPLSFSYWLWSELLSYAPLVCHAGHRLSCEV